jgi:hypothetical protein
MLRWGSDWRGFLAHIEANRHETRLDQWELQVQCRVLARIGSERLWFASDGIPGELQKKLALTPLPGEGDAVHRAQRMIDQYLAAHPRARSAVIPEGPHDAAREERARPLARHPEGRIEVSARAHDERSRFVDAKSAASRPEPPGRARHPGAPRRQAIPPRLHPAPRPGPDQYIQASTAR